MKKLFKEATAAELRAYALAYLGLQDLPADLTLPQLRARCMSAAGASLDFIEVEAGEPVPEPTRRAPAMAGEKDPLAPKGKYSDDNARGDPMVEVLISAGAPPDGHFPLHPCVNGSTMLIPRGEPVTIPIRYFLDLQGSVGAQLRIEGTELRTREVQSYPMSVMRWPADETIKAWLEAQGVADWRATYDAIRRGPVLKTTSVSVSS